MNRESGFTLMELLIVIAIIGLLASTITTASIGVKMKSRDAKRITELRSVMTALETYYIDHGKYPGSSPSKQFVRWTVSGFASNWVIADAEGIIDLKSELSPYIARLPNDPLNNGVAPFSCCGYTYFVSKDGSQYDLITIFEENHPLRCEVKNWPSYTGGWIGFSPTFPGLGNSWCGVSMNPFPNSKNIYSGHL